MSRKIFNSAAVFLLLMLSPLHSIASLYHEDFDAGALWTGGDMGSYTPDKRFARPGAPVVFVCSNEALRQVAADQDGAPATRGGTTHAWRLRNAGTGGWMATVGTGGVGEFALWVRRWDAKPDPEYVCEVSRDNGATYTAVQTLNNDWLGGSDWRRLRARVDVNNGPGQDDDIVIRIRRVDGERLLIDDFEMTTFGSTASLSADEGPTETATTTTSSTSAERVRKTGPGQATVANRDGSVLDGSTIFRRGQAGQVVALGVQGVDGHGIDSLEVDLPPGWSGLTADGVRLEGEAFTRAQASVQANTVVVSGAALTPQHPGVLVLSGLTARDSAGVEDDGVDRWPVRTVGADGVQAEIAHAPRTHITIPIANLRDVDAKGVPLDLTDEVAIEAVVTTTNEFSRTMTQAYAQDDTGGVVIFSKRPGLIPQSGRYVVYGDVIQFNGLTEVQPPHGADDVYRLGDAAPVVPVTRTLRELLADPEAYEGMLVEVESLVITGGAWPERGMDATLTVSDDCGPTTVGLRLDADTDIGGMPHPREPFRVVALLGQSDNTAPYNSRYQLLPRADVDFTPGAELAAPQAADGVAAGPDRFQASWSAVPGATEYRLDVSVDSAFGTPGLVACSNAYHGGRLGEPGWREVALDQGLQGGDAYLILTTQQSMVMSPPMDFDATEGETLEFSARTYGAVPEGQAEITISVSEDDGLNWTMVSRRQPDDAQMTPMMSVDLSRVGGTSVRLKLETLRAGNRGGVGVDALKVHAQRAARLPSYVGAYNDLPVAGTTHLMTGLAPGQRYYYRVRAATCAGEAGPHSNVATGVTLPD